MELAAHDLVSFNNIDDLLSDKPLPEWAWDTLKEGFFGVVRRDWHADKNLVPIGIRGVERGQRFAAWINAQNIKEKITPMSLTDPLQWKKKYLVALSDTVQTLIKISPLLNERFNLLWGPTGSVAYELATGYKAIKDTSDLDLVIRTSEKISVNEAQDLLNEIQSLAGCRLDIQLETPKGGVSLTEYSTSDQVLAKTNKGPFLHEIDTLWNAVKQ